MPFARQVLLLQIGVVALVVGVGFALVGWLLDDELVKQYQQRALVVARSVAADPGIGDEAARDDPNGVVAARADAVHNETHALYVVVTNRDGIRLSHPNAELIGQRVSTDASEALAGHDVLTVQQGTLGWSSRAKVPLRNSAGAIVGEVSVGFRIEDIRAHLWYLLGLAAPYAVGALLLGAAGSALLTRRLKRQTLGLEPHELAELVQEREAVLHGIGEGVLAVDSAGRVSVCNDEARRLLGIEVVPGTPVADLELPSRVRAAFDGAGPADNLITVAGDRVLVVGRRPVDRDGRSLGLVLTLRDRTDLETLTRELDSVRNLTDALRAQRHEFANRLHTIAGLLQTNHHAEAVEYLHALSGPGIAVGPGAESLTDPYLQAFLAAKTTEAREKDVTLRLGHDTWVQGRVVKPVEVTTVLGNLVDNALEAARLGARRPAWVEVDLLADGDTLHVSVADSGDGVPERLRNTIFTEGVSSRDGAGRGLGLALARSAARGGGGDVRLADPGGTDPGATDPADTADGAVFTAQMPGVLEVRP
ncbi:sensor histidine kinase [Planosporangium mesophilum]|nr:sensor histidine kinase [Planosporangium mesophilum]